MRKLKLQMQVSMDGYGSAGPNDEQGWVTWAWEEISGHVLALADSCDTILIGRKLAVDYIPYWQGVYSDVSDPMHEVSKRVVPFKKVVFSKTLSAADPSWKNTVVANGDLVEEVRRLKQEPGKDMIVYGGTNFVAGLIKENLIDEYHLFVNPVVLGCGDPVFRELKRFKFVGCTAFESGIVLMEYVAG